MLICFINPEKAPGGRDNSGDNNIAFRVRNYIILRDIAPLNPDLHKQEAKGRLHFVQRNFS